MDTRPSTIERAYQLAKTGQYRTVSEMKDRLRAEGYWDATAHFSSRTLMADLRRVIAAAHPDRQDRVSVLADYLQRSISAIAPAGARILPSWLDDDGKQDGECYTSGQLGKDR